MNRYRYTSDYRLPPYWWACLVDWSTWSEVCDFVPKPIFQVGTYLDKDDKPTESCDTNRMGVILNGKNGPVLVKQGEYIGYGLRQYFRSTPDGWYPI